VAYALKQLNINKQKKLARVRVLDRKTLAAHADLSHSFSKDTKNPSLLVNYYKFFKK